MYVIGAYRGRLWRVDLQHVAGLGAARFYSAVNGLVLFAYLALACVCPLGMAVYVMTMNLLYHVNIILDHDTFESAVRNRIDLLDKDHRTDWARMQISNSTNFHTHTQAGGTCGRRCLAGSITR